MGQKVVVRRQMGGGWQVPLSPELMLVICSLNVLESVPVLTYGSQTMLWKEKKRSRIRAVQMDNRRDLLGIRRMDGAPNARIR